MVMGLVALGTKNRRAGEDHKQYSSQSVAAIVADGQ
jgi:hypothetical protein